MPAGLSPGLHHPGPRVRCQTYDGVPMPGQEGLLSLPRRA